MKIPICLLARKASKLYYFSRVAKVRQLTCLRNIFHFYVFMIIKWRIGTGETAHLGDVTKGDYCDDQI